MLMLRLAPARRLLIGRRGRLDPAQLDADGVQHVGREGRDRDGRAGLIAVF
jgi:hypothetical protein